MELTSTERCFGGEQRIYQHDSSACGCRMSFAAYLPEPAPERPLAAVVWLSGLTCTEQNFITKAGAQRLAAELGLVLIAPDTSPRGDPVPDDPDGRYDLGLGAGFYVDATEPPWSQHYRMYSYVSDELHGLITAGLPIDPERIGIFGHSMGGHGALTLHLRNPERYRSVSAFAPIVAPSAVPWGRRAFSAYLGDDESAWLAHDATALVAAQPSTAPILIDQGAADEFLEKELQPERFAAAAEAAGQPFTLRMQPGYTHSYYFIASFIDDHLRHHARGLGAA
ncbi:MAG: S-formylglutathione hydrolase [Pseudomonadota bacterium]